MKMNFETGNVLFLVGCVTVILLVGAPEFTEAGFEFGAYCRKLCAWGKGGNLCKCSAVHFAGKRVEGDEGFPDMQQESEVLGDGGANYYRDLPEYMEKEDEHQPKKTSLEDIRKLYRQMETMNRLNGPSKTTEMILDTLQKILTSGDSKSVASNRS